MLLRAVALALVVLPAGGTIDGLWATSVASACFRDPEPPASLLPKDKFFKQLAGPEQRAVRLLGWTATSWDGGDPSPMENKFWGAWLEPARGARATLLSAEERSAAEILGFRSQKLWDHGISNGVIDELEASLLAAVQQQDCTPGWDQPVLRGLLSKPSDGIKGLDRARVWVEAATRHYVEAALAALPDTGGQRAVVNLTDSWLSVGKPQEWRGAAVAAHPRSDIVGHLFISCPSATATCQLQLMDPRPRAHALTTNNFKAGTIRSEKWQSAQPTDKAFQRLAGCSVVFPGWINYQHWPASDSGYDATVAATSTDAEAPPRMWLSFTADLLSITPVNTGLQRLLSAAQLPQHLEAISQLGAVEVADVATMDEAELVSQLGLPLFKARRLVRLAKERSSELAPASGTADLEVEFEGSKRAPGPAEAPFSEQPSLQQLWGSPVAVTAASKKQRDGVLAAKRSILGMAASLPSMSVSNFGGWQSPPDLFTNASTSSLPGIPLARELIQTALELYVHELIGPAARGEIVAEIEASWANVNSGSSWNSPHGHTGDISGALYLACPAGTPCEIALLDPRVAAATPVPGLMSDVELAVARAQGVGQIVKQMQEGEVLLFPTWVEHHVPPHAIGHNGIVDHGRKLARAQVILTTVWLPGTLLMIEI